MGPFGNFRPHERRDDTAAHNEGNGDTAPFFGRHIGRGEPVCLSRNGERAEKHDRQQIEFERPLKYGDSREQGPRRSH